MTSPLDSNANFVRFQIYSLPDTLLVSSVEIKQPTHDVPTFAVTPDSNTVIILQSPHNFLIADMSNKTNIREISNTVNKSLSMSSVILSNDGQTAFIFGAGLYTYDISTPSNPSLLFDYQFPEGVVTVTQSPDDNTVFITVDSADDSDHCTLYIIDVANLTSPTFISTLALSDGCTGSEIGYHPYVIPMEPDGQVLLLPLENYVVAIDVSILELPTPLDYYSLKEASIIVCPNYNSIYALSGFYGNMTIITLYPENILYSESNTFQLGPTNSITLDLFTRNPGSTYDIELSSYKFTDMNLFLLDDTYGSMKRAYSVLPNWMDFDQNHGLLTLAPDSGSQIGVYSLSGTLSLQMSNTTFIGINSINNVSDSLDLMVTLVSLGYLDNQGYLTSSFNSSQPLLLTQQYRTIEPQIRQTMANYSIQASMSIYITQSLILTLPDPPSYSISIDTLSLEPLNIMITLEGNTSSPPKFVSLGYSFTASFSQNNTAISMVMSLYNANSALSQLIIFLNQSMSCSANITIIDGLNPTLTQIVPDITQYFKISSPPLINTSYFQYQLARVSPETGTQFVFQIDSSTFTDLNNEPLTLSIQMEDPTLQVPEWLELKGYSLIGTPPEQLTGREMDLILIVSNQYQSAQIEFSLDAGISIEYVWKLIGTYGGALITVIGLLMYATRIYNILAKKYYRFSKNFTVSVGQDIDFKTLYPIFFGSKPILESKIITRQLDKKIGQEIGNSSKTKIATHFTDNVGRINRIKLIEAIEEAAVEIGKNNKSKLKLYTPVLTPEKELINHIIINNYIIRLLDSNEAKQTKKAFNLIKRNVFNLVDLDKCLQHGLCIFSINKENLDSELRKHSIKTLNQVCSKEREINDLIDQSQSQPEESLLETENAITQSYVESAASIELLAYVLEAYAFNNHIIDADVLQVDVISKQKITGKWLEMIRSFLKLDLKTVSFSKKGLIGCGIKYSIEESSLVFSGNAHKDIKDQTLVVQIVNSSERILRELWVNGVDAEPERKLISEDVL